MLLLVLLIAALIVFLYPFLVYPVLLSLVVRLRSESLSGVEAPAPTPTVALIICALNEQSVIREKMENCLALDYPAHKLHVIVVSDGSTDATASIVREYGSRGVRLIERSRRRGKVANLNNVVGSLREEIIAFSDANVMYHPQALRRLIAGFADPTVGCTSGKVVLTDTTTALEAPERTYYSLEWMLQEKASRFYSMAGADGAMYALRRSLFQPCPNDTLIEDFVIPLAIVNEGKRVVFRPLALGWEKGPGSLREEFRRKVRIAAGAAQALIRGNGWPRRAPLRFWFVFLSHKFLRWLSPLAGLTVMALALSSSGSGLSRLVLSGAALVTTLAVLRLLTNWSTAILNAPFYFLFGQLALLIGLIKGLRGRQSVLWAKPDR